MNIIIVGCGKVGGTIAEQLASENHDIVIVDNDAERLHQVGDMLDVMCVHGNGGSATVLEEAGAKTCDLLIAVTLSDELNLLTCLIAKKLGAANTIARVRNPIYADGIHLVKDDLGLSMIINPELAAASEISRTLRFPSAIKVETFAKSRVEVINFRITPGNMLCGIKLENLKSTVKTDIFICAVQRGNEVFIPNGSTELMANDVISFLASPGNAHEFFKKIGASSHKIKDMIIIGGGRLTYYLTKMLLQVGIRVKIIEEDLKRCEELSELLPEAMIIHGDGTDNELLHEEGIEEADAVATLTGLDEQNVIMSLYATQYAPQAKLFTKIKHFDFDDMLKSMDIGSVIYPKYITADHIIKYVRVMQNSIGSNVETLHHIVDDKVEVLEFRIREESEMLGVPIEKLKIRPGVLVACISRGGKGFIPGGKDTIEFGDTVIIVTTNKGLYDIENILSLHPAHPDTV